MSKTKKKFAKQKKMLHSAKPKPIIEEKLIENIEPQLDDFFKLNHQLIPPYNVILDTNFINFSIKKKIDIERELMRSLCSGVKIYITDCVIAELEKLGRVFKVALNLVKQYNRLTCDHKGTYADDCIINRITTHRCYLIATCDTELKMRIRKVPGVPIIYVKGYTYEVEKLPRTVIKKL